MSRTAGWLGAIRESVRSGPSDEAHERKTARPGAIHRQTRMTGTSPATETTADGVRSTRSLARATPLVGRLLLCLAMFFLVPALALLVGSVIWRVSSVLGGIQLWNLLFTGLTIGAGLGIWRRFVRWTLGRAATTAITVLVSLAQVIWWQPVLGVGCVSGNILRTGQNLSLLSLWVWAVVWL